MMRAVIFAALLAIAPAQAQMPTLGAGGGGFGGAGGGGGFSGVGDVVSGATAYYSCARAYNAAYATAAGNLCIIADVATGNTSTCTMKAAASGKADLTSLLCAGGTQTVSAFCTAHTSCVVSTMFDQTAGNHCTASPTSCDVVQATLANMPALTFNSINSLPCLTMTVTKTMATVTPLNAIAVQPYTAAVVSKQTSSVGNGGMFGTGGGTPGHYYPSGGNAVAIFAGANLVASQTDNAYHGIQFIGNGASGGINVSGTLTSGNTGTSGWGVGGAHIVVGEAGTGFNGSWCEGGIWPVAFSGGQQSSWFSNANGANGYNGGL